MLKRCQKMYAGNFYLDLDAKLLIDGYLVAGRTMGHATVAYDG
jgi:hypothetical protein